MAASDYHPGIKEWPRYNLGCQKCDAKDAEIARLRVALLQLEWDDEVNRGGWCEPACSLCGGTESSGHYHECVFHALRSTEEAGK